ncbi:LysR family transcriptional regulator [Caulobacter sp.]|uniref:LysR family transcriptional regulator n=1 Tax=Caulobacter sp. TaxID=78 RepID=UPI0031D49F12
MADQLADFIVFARIAESGSLTAAAASLNLSLAAVSRRLMRLEERLGVRLINRTTRTLSLTDEGAAFHLRATRILEDIAEAEAEVSRGQNTAVGLLRVTTTFAFGRRRLASLVHAFEREHPGVRVHLDASDRVVDLVNEGFDVAVRFGPLADSSLIARPVAANDYVLCASPDYLDRRGRPTSLEELASHDAVLFGAPPPDVWTFADGRQVRMRGDLTTNDGDLAHVWALEGAGVIMKAVWDVAGDIQRGDLEIVLPKVPLPDAPIHAVYPHNRLAAAKTRLFVAFLARTLRGHWERDIAPILPIR